MTDPNPSIEISIEHPVLRLDENRIRRLINFSIADQGYAVTSLSIVLTGHRQLAKLNKQYLDREYVTDVLSFSFAEDCTARTIDGEVYVDMDTAAERHEEFRTTFEMEALRYIVHGLLHLMGYNDDTVEGRARMHRLENVYLDHLASAG